MSSVKCPTIGKVCYTRAEAKTAAASYRRRSISTHPVSVYKCPDWKHHPDAQFHIGHTPSKRRRQRRARRAR